MFIYIFLGRLLLPIFLWRFYLLKTNIIYLNLQLCFLKWTFRIAELYFVWTSFLTSQWLPHALTVCIIVNIKYKLKSSAKPFGFHRIWSRNKKLISWWTFQHAVFLITGHDCIIGQTYFSDFYVCKAKLNLSVSRRIEIESQHFFLMKTKLMSCVCLYIEYWNSWLEPK